MLTILSLLGVLMAGVSADAILGLKAHSPDSDDDDTPPDEPEDEQGDLLDFEDMDRSGTDLSGSPVSDDIDNTEDPDMLIVGGAGGDILSGGDGDDQIDGAAGGDQIDGQAGDDSIDAGDGHDAVWAGDGNDTVVGGAGDDSVAGQAGDDSILGDAGDDSLSGHDGDDSLFGGADADTLLGGSGDDRLDGGTGNDWLAGGDQNDHIAGGAGSDVLDGNAGNDWISGLNGHGDDGETDFLNGGEGDDTLILGRGDYATGGGGADTFAVQDWAGDTDVATIADYDYTQDQLVVVYDATVHPNPQLSLAANKDTDEVTILLDGAPVALVKGASVFLRDIQLTAA
jgi:Ca2+-binding RTX toxin-like protein